MILESQVTRLLIPLVRNDYAAYVWRNTGLAEHTRDVCAARARSWRKDPMRRDNSSFGWCLRIKRCCISTQASVTAHQFLAFGHSLYHNDFSRSLSCCPTVFLITILQQFDMLLFSLRNVFLLLSLAIISQSLYIPSSK